MATINQGVEVKRPRPPRFPLVFLGVFDLIYFFGRDLFNHVPSRLFRRQDFTSLLAIARPLQGFVRPPPSKGGGGFCPPLPSSPRRSTPLVFHDVWKTSRWTACIDIFNIILFVVERYLRPTRGCPPFEQSGEPCLSFPPFSPFLLGTLLCQGRGLPLLQAVRKKTRPRGHGSRRAPPKQDEHPDLLLSLEFFLPPSLFCIGCLA